MIFSGVAFYTGALVIIAQKAQTRTDRANEEAAAKHRDELAQFQSDLLTRNTDLTEQIHALSEKIHAWSERMGTLTQEVHEATCKGGASSGRPVSAPARVVAWRGVEAGPASVSGLPSGVIWSVAVGSVATVLPAYALPMAQFSRSGILERAAALEQARAAVHEAFANARSRDDEPWRKATVRLRAAQRALYSDDFLAEVAQLQAGETGAVETALTFLEADPWCFRSGYVKADLMRFLVRASLTPTQRQRVEQVLVQVVDAGDRREFGRACQLARRHGTDTLRVDLKLRLRASDPGVLRRALAMLVSLDDPRLQDDELVTARRWVDEEQSQLGLALAREVERGWDAPVSRLWSINRGKSARRVDSALRAIESRDRESKAGRLTPDSAT